MKARNISGFTLVEVMVFSLVSLMLIGLLAQVFLTATRRTEDSRLRVDLQQNAILILQRFERDLLRATAGSIAGYEGEQYILSMTPLVSWDGQGGQVWSQKQVAWVHNPARKTLHQEEVGPSAFGEDLLPFKPYQASNGELLNIATTVSGQERVLSSHVEEFALSDSTGNRTSFGSQPLKLEMTLRRPLSTSQRHAEFTVERRYALRNI